ncbi:hypothetical protein Bwad005_26820 [Bilophila wadsworthia]
MASSIWVWHGSMAATGRWKEKRGEVRRAPFFSLQSARLPVDGESADMPQGWCCFPTGVKRKGRCVMRVSIGCGFFQARFPVEDVKEADALEKG